MHTGIHRLPDSTKRLPVEILALIFQAWKDACDEGRHGMAADWVRATWVCQRWRDVALDTPPLWSSVLISESAEPLALETQLNRARGIALDLVVSCAWSMTSELIAEAFKLLLSETKSVKYLEIIYDESTTGVIKRFVRAVATEVISLSIHCEFFGDEDFRWEFTADILPRLARLALRSIIPIPGSPLLHLIRLELSDAYDETLARAEGYPPYIHTFLASCPNLQSLRIDDSFGYAYHHNGGTGLNRLPIVTLPKLRHLSMYEYVLDIAPALGALRLPSLSSFDITARCLAHTHDFTYWVIPKNVEEVLPPIPLSRSLALAMGATVHVTPDFRALEVTRHLLDLRGSSGHDTPDQDWAITVHLDDPDLEVLRANCDSFLYLIPELVVPSILLHFELHIAPHGLPVERDWARFFAVMPRLRTLVVGSGSLLRYVLPALDKDRGLCPELQDLALCATAGRDVDGDTLAEFIPRVVAAWARQRAEVGKGLRSLTVWTPPDGSDEGAHSQATPARSSGTALGGLLCDSLHALCVFVGTVVVEVKDCASCRAEYGAGRGRF